MICVVYNNLFNVTVRVYKMTTILKRTILLLFGFCSNKNIAAIFNYLIIVGDLTKIGR